MPRQIALIVAGESAFAAAMLGRMGLTGSPISPKALEQEAKGAAEDVVRAVRTTSLAGGDGAHGDRGEDDQRSDREEDDQGGNREFRLCHRGLLRHPVTQTCLDRQ